MKLPLALVFSLALLALAMPAHALVGPDVRVVGAAFSADLVPGGNSLLTVKLTNVGVFPCAYKVQTQIQVSNPLSTQGVDTRLVNAICEPNTTTVSFWIAADASAPAGAYPVNLVTTYESEYRASYTTYNTVYARVQGTPNLLARVVKSTPVNVYPGDDFTVDVAVDNVGAYRADSLTFTLSSPGALEVKPTSATQSAATLAPRASITKTFAMHAPKTANAAAYPLFLDASFLDENGTTRSQRMPVTLTVSGKARFDATDGTAVAHVDTRNNALLFHVTNVGTDVAKRVRVKLLPSFPFATQGSVQYIETLAPGESRDLTFYADVDKEGVPGTYALDLSVTFENTDGQSFTDTVPVSAKVDYTPLLEAIFVNFWYVWVIALLAAAFILPKRLKAMKAAKSKEEPKAKTGKK